MDAPNGTATGRNWVLDDGLSVVTAAVLVEGWRTIVRWLGTSWMLTETLPVGCPVGLEFVSVRISCRVDPAELRAMSARRAILTVVPSGRMEVVVVHSCALNVTLVTRAGIPGGGGTL